MNKILDQPSHEELEKLLSQNSYVHKYVKTRRRAGVGIKKQHTKKVFKIVSRVSIAIIDESWQLLIPRDQKRPMGPFRFGGFIRHSGNYSTEVIATSGAGKSIANT